VKPTVLGQVVEGGFGFRVDLGWRQLGPELRLSAQRFG
jgi:hypothetical protein